MSENNFFEKHPKLATTTISLIVGSILCAAVFYVVNMKILKDGDNKEKHSIAEQISYAVRCGNERNIRLREVQPNRYQEKFPIQEFETLEYKKYILRSDEDGIIKPSFIHKDPDLQIFFLGGSTTECETVDEEFRFPYLTGRKLEKDLNIKVNSDNAARAGNNSLHSINILINKLLPYNPDIVLMMHNINDLSALFYEGTYWNENPSIAPINCRKTSRTIKNNDQWSSSNWQNKVASDPKEQDRLVREFRENLKLFINICRAKNIIPVLLTQPNRIANDPNFDNGRGKDLNASYKNLYIRFSQSIRQIGVEEKVLVIDLEKKVPSSKKYIYDPVHVNKEGSILEAEEISKQLQIYLKKNHFKKLSTN